MSKARYIGLGAGALLIAGVVATTALGHGAGGPGMGRHGGAMMKHFNKLDANRDQVVTREEAEKARDEKFAGMDADKDGAVSIAEIDEVIEKRLNRMRARMRYHMLARFDEDGNGSIDKQEFDKNAARRFARVDHDGDGKVSRKEAWQAARKMGRHMAKRGMMRHMGDGHMGGGYMGGHMGGGQMGSSMNGQMGDGSGGAETDGKDQK